MISDYRMALLQAFDAFFIIISLLVSGFLTLTPDLFIIDDYTGACLFTIFFYMLFLYILDAYNVGAEDFRDTFGRTAISAVLAVICSATASYTFDHWRFDRETLTVFFGLSLFFCLAWRYLYYRNAEKLTHPLRVLLIGTDRAGKVGQLLAESLPSARLIGYVGEQGLNNGESLPWLGHSFSALETAQKHGATMIVLLPDAPIDDDIAHELLMAKLRGTMVVDIRSFYEHVVHRLPVHHISDEWLLLDDGFSLNTRGSLRRLKRATDMLISLFLLTITSPVMLLSALIIRLESKGPIIYKQNRVGLHEKEFPVYKFRSMRIDAEKDGAVWASKNDTRVTRFGKFIRKVRIDELPQLYNVLKGDMSLIGPRPERMEFVTMLKESIPYYSLRHSIKPGVTGWAQVCYPYGASVEDARHKLEYDLYYIKNMSILLDLKIILKTIGVVLFPKGSR